MVAVVVDSWYLHSYPLWPSSAMKTKQVLHAVCFRSQLIIPKSLCTISPCQLISMWYECLKKLAIHPIPGIGKMMINHWVLGYPDFGGNFQDSQQACNFSSWRKRGWCRLAPWGNWCNGWWNGWWSMEVHWWECSIWILQHSTSIVIYLLICYIHLYT